MMSPIVRIKDLPVFRIHRNNLRRSRSLINADQQFFIISFFHPVICPSAVTIHSRFILDIKRVVLAQKHLLSSMKQDCEAVTPPT